MKEIDKKYEKLRCNLYLPAEIVERVDELAKTYGAPRNVMIAFMLKTYLDQQSVVNLANMAPKE
ncbi:MAG: ribbon-helix-helix protein, CopG family [Romboutsia sp.]|nr:ribbon-helix-helix protein, CopG family [Romboutsia sp.]